MKVIKSTTKYILVSFVIFLIGFGCIGCNRDPYQKEEIALMFSVSKAYMNSMSEYLSVTEGLTEEEMQQSEKATLASIQLSGVMDSAEDVLYLFPELTDLMQEGYEYAMENDRDEVLEIMNEITEFLSEYE